ncbi:MAG: hypothetical protein ACLQVI_33780 [Polyangiaceae bacterium]|jgi:hypothetical protein
MSVALTHFERRWAHAAFDTIFPGPDRGVLPLGIADMDLDGFIDQTLEQVPFEASFGLRLVFWVIGLAPLFILGRFATIASLPPADRMRVISTINASPIYPLRATVMMLKALGALFYCGDRRVRPSIVAVLPPVVTLRPRRGALVTSATSGAEHEPHRRTA